MKKRRIKKSKPMFKKKRSPARTALNVILVIVLLSAIAFLGYSVGKPIMDFMNGRQEVTKPVDSTEPAATATAPPTTTTEPTSATVATEDEQDEPIVEGKRLLFVELPHAEDFDTWLDRNIEFAAENGYYGIVVELIADGGEIGYNTSNEKAIAYSAVSQYSFADLSAAVERISQAGLLPYARISALTDHIVSRLDKGMCYLFENSTSTWLDNSVSAGGKSWITPFTDASKEYINSFITEASEAGFAGIIAGELIFPPFRRSDLNYVGAVVQSPTRYTALAEFSNSMQDTLGSAKSFAIEIDALDILAGSAEVLTDTSLLNCNTLYIYYDSAEIGERVEKTDGTEISYSGLSESDKLSIVFRSVAESLSDSGKTLIPAVTDKSLIPALVELGYDEKLIIVY